VFLLRHTKPPHEAAFLLPIASPTTHKIAPLLQNKNMGAIIRSALHRSALGPSDRTEPPDL